MPDEKARAKNKTARVTPGGFRSRVGLRLFTIAEQMEQEDEHIDEVQIERQGAHDGLFLSNSGAIANRINRFDLLRVISRKAGKDQYTQNGNRELQC